MTQKELIDKQHMLEDMNAKLQRFKREQDATNDHARFMYIEGELHILRYYLSAFLEGTFDDHSAQEEIAKLKHELQHSQDNMKMAVSSMEAKEARAIQAEQERDELKVANDGLRKITVSLSERAAQAEQERDELRNGVGMDEEERYALHLEIERMKEERNALLEGLKQIARPIPSSYAEVAPVTFARSIIAKIEGK